MVKTQVGAPGVSGPAVMKLPAMWFNKIALTP